MVDSTERGRYIPTGWRVVGRDADAIADRVATDLVEHLEAGAPSDSLYAVRFTLPSEANGRPTIETLLDLLTEDVRRTWPEAPRLARDTPLDQAPSRLGGLHFAVLPEPGRQWTGELIWRAVHPMVSGVPITTRVLLEGRPTFTRVSLRVTADNGLASVRGLVGAGQAQPAFIRAMRRQGLIPTWLGGPLRPHPVREGEVPDLVKAVLADPDRTAPVVVLAPLEEGGYNLSPDDLAWDLLGRAELYVLQEHKQTFELTDTVGDRRMSCYWGAARAYMPGWNRHDDPYDHPLLVGDRVRDPVLRAVWAGELGVNEGIRLQLPPPLVERTAASPSRPADGPAIADRRPESPAHRPEANSNGSKAPRPGKAASPNGVAAQTQTPSTAPATAPGWIVLDVIPNSPSSIANVLANPTNAHFVAAYAMRLGYPKRPASDDMVTTDPPVDSLSSGIARCVTRNVPCRFTSTTAAQASTRRTTSAPKAPAHACRAAARFAYPAPVAYLGVSVRCRGHPAWRTGRGSGVKVDLKEEEA